MTTTDGAQKITALCIAFEDEVREMCGYPGSGARVVQLVSARKLLDCGRDGLPHVIGYLRNRAGLTNQYCQYSGWRLLLKAMAERLAHADASAAGSSLEELITWAEEVMAQ